MTDLDAPDPRLYTSSIDYQQTSPPGCRGPDHATAQMSTLDEFDHTPRFGSAGSWLSAREDEASRCPPNVQVG